MILTNSNQKVFAGFKTSAGLGSKIDLFWNIFAV